MERKEKARRERRALLGTFGRLESPVHHRWSRAAAEEMSHHQCQACAAAGAERAQGEPVGIARDVIAPQLPANIRLVNRNSAFSNDAAAAALKGPEAKPSRSILACVT
jgi:hypothetical protein